MAGRPKTRARLEALGAIPEAIPDAGSSASEGGAMHAPARAPARVREPRRGPGGYLGANTRQAADMANAAQLTGMAQHLRPGVGVRIERMRPTWCAGWLEDATITTGTYAELLDYLREEYGGRTYRVTVLLPNGAPAFESTIDVAGQPRHEGRPIDRDVWMGEGSRRQQAQVAAPAAQPAGFEGMLAFLKMFMDQQRDSADRQLGAVRQLVESSAAQNQSLVEAMLEARTAESGSRSFASQLGELLEAERALGKARRLFGGTNTGRAPNEAENDDDPLNGALKEATKHFLGNALAGAFTGGRKAPFRRGPRPHQTPPAGPPQRQRVAPSPRPRGVPTSHTSAIPDALQAGHKPN